MFEVGPGDRLHEDNRLRSTEAQIEVPLVFTLYAKCPYYLLHCMQHQKVSMNIHGRTTMPRAGNWTGNMLSYHLVDSTLAYELSPRLGFILAETLLRNDTRQANPALLL